MNFIFCHNLTVTTRGTERVTVKIGSYIIMEDRSYAIYEDKWIKNIL